MKIHPAADTADLVVVGAGIVGLGAAYAGIRRGLSVIVLDRTGAPVGASIRNFGHLCIGAQTGMARRFADASAEIWKRLATDAGFWLRASGTLIAAQREDELAVLESAADDPGFRMLSAQSLRRRAPLRADAVIGGALIETDLQVNPRTSAATIIRHLSGLGVDFRFRTAATAVAGDRVETTRGTITAGRVVVATNHDIDQLLPEVAEGAGIVRCALDMMRVSADLPRELDAPLLTGWSLLRYGRFSAFPATAALRERMHAERPDLAALDLNQMYTQLTDGTLIIGDSHVRGIQPEPFQPEAAFTAFLDEAAVLFDTDGFRVLERWQGVYASGKEEFLIEEPEPGLHVIAATTGIGMTCGLGLAEHALSCAIDREAVDSTAIDRAPQPALGGTS